MTENNDKSKPILYDCDTGSQLQVSDFFIGDVPHCSSQDGQVNAIGDIEHSPNRNAIGDIQHSSSGGYVIGDIRHSPSVSVDGNGSDVVGDVEFSTNRNVIGNIEHSRRPYLPVMHDNNIDEISAKNDGENVRTLTENNQKILDKSEHNGSSVKSDHNTTDVEVSNDGSDASQRTFPVSGDDDDDRSSQSEGMIFVDLGDIGQSDNVREKASTIVSTDDALERLASQELGNDHVDNDSKMSNDILSVDFGDLGVPEPVETNILTEPYAGVEQPLPDTHQKTDSKKSFVWLGILAFLLILALGLGLGIGLGRNGNDKSNQQAGNQFSLDDNIATVTDAPTNAPTNASISADASTSSPNRPINAFPSNKPTPIMTTVSTANSFLPTKRPAALPTELPTFLPSLLPTARPLQVLFTTNLSLPIGDYFTLLKADCNLITREGTVENKGDFVWKSHSGNKNFEGDCFLALNADGKSVSIYQGNTTDSSSYVEVWTTRIPARRYLDVPEGELIPLLKSGEHISSGDGPLVVQDEVGISLLQASDGSFVIFSGNSQQFLPTFSSRPSVEPVAVPSQTPTLEPSSTPSSLELAKEDASNSPSVVQSSSAIPTAIDLASSPTIAPSVITASPTMDLSSSPTLDLSSSPTLDLSSSPTLDLSSSPTLDLSSSPILDLSSSPTLDLTSSPTMTPQLPSSSPARVYSASPSVTLSVPPTTISPSRKPITIAPVRPTPMPTPERIVKKYPTSSPTLPPTPFPTRPSTPLPTAPGPTPAPTDGLVGLICTVSDCAALDDPNSYQFKALSWMKQDGLYKLYTNDAKILQRYALACIYFSTNGVSNVRFNNPDTWAVTTNWLNKDDECNGWFGITCVGIFVERIELPKNKLSGVFPYETYLLRDSLRLLDIKGNYLNNQGPEQHDFLGSLTKLTHLDYNDCWFELHSSGGIPSVISQLTNLQYYDCSYNVYTGKIDGKVFSNLQVLAYLDISGCVHEAEVPLEIATLPLLNTFYMHDSDIIGNLDYLASMTSIRNHGIGWNPQLTGTIPSSIGTKNSKLVEFAANNCSLTGAIITELGLLTDLNRLDLYANHLSGNIPSEIGSIKNLQEMYIYENDLGGMMPAEICDLRVDQLRVLETDCQGAMPEVTCKCCTKCYESEMECEEGDKDLETFLCSVTNCHEMTRNCNSYQHKAYRWLSANQFLSQYSDEKKIQRYALACIYFATSPIPGPNPSTWNDNTLWLRNNNECDGWFGITCVGGYVESIELDNNNLVGIFPRETALLKDNLKRLSFNGNSVYNAGLEEHEFLGELTNLVYLSYHDNELEFDHGIPPTISKLINLQYYDCGANQYYDNVEGSIFSNLSELTHLDISGLDHRAEVPTEIAKLPKLSHFYFYESQVTGTLDYLSSMKAIEEHWIYGNFELSGAIPASIGTQNVKLRSFDVSDCSLDGTIPTSVGLLKDLEVLNINNNNLQGNLPHQIGFMQSLIGLDFENNKIDGSLPTMLGALTKLEYLFGSENLLSGALPPEIGLMNGLTKLIMVNNKLTGTLPTYLSLLTKLEYLLLYNNLLIGTVPSELGRMSSLTYLDIENNLKMEGEIPEEVCDLRPNPLENLNVDCDNIECNCCTNCDSTGSTPQDDEYNGYRI